jgi:hypothetical protein
LIEDPYEFTNLYYSTDVKHERAKKKLYGMLDDYAAKARTKISIVQNYDIDDIWTSNEYHVLPWDFNATDDDTASSSTAPTLCEGFTLETR